MNFLQKRFFERKKNDLAALRHFLLFSHRLIAYFLQMKEATDKVNSKRQRKKSIFFAYLNSFTTDLLLTLVGTNTHST